MKSRLSASISRLLPGERRRSFCISNAFLSSLNLMLFSNRYPSVYRFQYQGFQSSSKVSSCTEDDFAELGPSAEGLAASLKLLTEKPEYMQNGPKAKGLSRASTPVSAQSVSGAFRNLDNSSETSRSTLQDCNNLSRRSDDQKNSSNSDSFSSTNAGNMTGEVDNSNTDFEMVTIRIQGIAKETTDHIVHSICKSIGALDGLVKANDAVDVLFRVNKDSDAQYIVKRLNDTVIDDSHWSAHEVLKNSTSSPTIDDARTKMGLQVNSGLSNMKRQLDQKKVYFEDLLQLHMGIMHLEGLPTIIDPSNKE